MFEIDHNNFKLSFASKLLVNQTESEFLEITQQLISREKRRKNSLISMAFHTLISAKTKIFS